MLSDSLKKHFHLSRLRAHLAISALALVVALPAVAPAQERGAPQTPKVVVDDDGTVHVPAQAVPMSSFLSPEAKAYVTQHLKYMLDPQQSVQENGIPRYMVPYLNRQREIYPVNREDTKIAGVHAYVYTPKAGIDPKNEARVLINLHGGGFSGCWPGCAELESIPVSGLGKIKVIALDYRQGPKYKFPAASEDVAAVYKELLKSHQPENIGIYGCSAGGMLTAMSLAWFQTHNLPNPGAVGVFCAGAGPPGGGDADYTATPLGEARLTPSLPPSGNGRGAQRAPSWVFGRHRSKGSVGVAYQFPSDHGQIPADFDHYRNTRYGVEWCTLHPHSACEVGRGRPATRLGGTLPRFLLQPGCPGMQRRVQRDGEVL